MAAAVPAATTIAAAAKTVVTHIPSAAVRTGSRRSEWTWGLPLLLLLGGAVWWLIGAGQTNQRALLEKQKIEMAAKAATEAEAKRKADADAAARLAAEAETKRRAEADATARRLAAEAELKRKAEADALTARLAVEAEAKRRAEAIVLAARSTADLEAQRKAEKDEGDARAARIAIVTEARRKTDASMIATRIAAEDAEAKRRADAAAVAARSAAEADAKRKADADALAARVAAEAEAKRRADAAAIAARTAAEAEAKRKADADALAARIAAEAEAKRKADAQTAVAEAAAKRATDLNVCRLTVATALRSGAIRFAVNSAELVGESGAVIDRIATAVKACPPVAVRVEGHTDASGNAEANQELSDERAKAVKAALTKAGVSTASITALGLGQTKPIAQNDTPENKAKNRRIEVSVEPL